ncbi:ParB-like chromosome segregation protein Spo0J [Nocardiopsis sp. Huas11]|uniref:ParB N-terminal domain-containing protein n=1 Tax=Nocardiopsis sp. Huas11 TaxID=2183912 RepID=UPI000EB43D34|nr:ParB N-terminal domain-containing protein [Nocardiopsis sp. Huas11]RKS05899.1 ParB-like chromosome segregation protein Spo0J [Nocardiopsis sp. Huas11]
MSSTFGAPPRGEHVKGIIQQRLNQAMSENGAKITIDWRGEPRHLYVISMPVDLLYFNPDTHRIRAQRTLDPERDRAIEEDPWGQQAQDYLRDLLRQRPANPDQVDPDYTSLMDELDDSGQREPGIVSPYGILVDGNTRAAALQELGEKNIRVGVLPDDTSRQDINDVELSLQLRKDRRRDYSYINRLIAIDEEVGRGRAETDVAKDFNIKLPTLQRDRWVYGLILEAIDRSKSDDGASALRLIDFEQHQEKLRELHRDYTKLAAKDPEAAQRLKQSRLAMVLLDYPKTSLRLAESDFYTRYLESRLPEDLKTKAAVPHRAAVPGIPEAILPQQSTDSAQVKALTDQLLRAKAVAGDSKSASPTDIADASALMRKARDTFDTAVKLAGQNAELVKRQTAVPERLTDAADYVTQCANEFAEAKAKRALDDEAFDDALLVLRTSLESLARQAGRTYSAPGEGVAWLLDAVRDK